MTDTLADKMHTALMAERPLLRARQADICADVATDYYAELVAAARKHTPVTDDVESCTQWCSRCGTTWPCGVAAALAAIEHPEAGR